MKWIHIIIHLAPFAFGHETFSTPGLWAGQGSTCAFCTALQRGHENGRHSKRKNMEEWHGMARWRNMLQIYATHCKPMQNSCECRVMQGMKRWHGTNQLDPIGTSNFWSRSGSVWPHSWPVGDGIRDVSVELQECVWRCDELLEHRKAEESKVEVGLGMAFSCIIHEAALLLCQACRTMRYHVTMSLCHHDSHKQQVPIAVRLAGPATSAPGLLLYLLERGRGLSLHRCQMNTPLGSNNIFLLWMEEILHQLVDGLSHCNPTIYSVL